MKLEVWESKQTPVTPGIGANGTLIEPAKLVGGTKEGMEETGRCQEKKCTGNRYSSQPCHVQKDQGSFCPCRAQVG